MPLDKVVLVYTTEFHCVFGYECDMHCLIDQCQQLSGMTFVSLMLLSYHTKHRTNTCLISQFTSSSVFDSRWHCFSSHFSMIILISFPDKSPKIVPKK